MINTINDIIKRQDEFNENLNDNMECFILSIYEVENVYDEKYTEFSISNNGYNKNTVTIYDINNTENLYQIISKIIFIFKPKYYISGKYPIMNELLDILCTSEKIHPIYHLLINKSLNFESLTYKKHLYNNIDHYLIKISSICSISEELNSNIQWICDALKSDTIEYTNYDIDNRFNWYTNGVYKNYKGYLSDKVLSVSTIDDNTFIDVKCRNSIINILNEICIPLPEDIDKFFKDNNKYYHNHEELLYKLNDNIISLFYISNYNYDYSNDHYCDICYEPIADITINLNNNSFKCDIKRGGFRSYYEYENVLYLINKINKFIHSNNITMK